MHTLMERVGQFFIWSFIKYNFKWLHLYTCDLHFTKQGTLQSKKDNLVGMKNIDIE